MWRSIKRLTNNRVIRNVAIVVSGTAGAQAISLVFSPLVTRLYTPEAFGILGTFLAILAVTAPLAALNYPMAIVLPKHDDEAICLVQLSILLGLINAILIAGLLWLWGGAFVALIGLEAMAPYMFALPVAIGLSAFLTSMMQWVIRKKKFVFKAKIGVVQALLVNGAKVAIGMVIPQAGVLILVTTFGSGLHAFMLSRQVSSFAFSTRSVRLLKPFSTYQKLAFRYKDFVFFRTPQSILNAASQGLPLVILTASFGASTAGFYALSRMVLEAPAKLVGHSVVTVLYPRINEAAMERESIPRLVFNATLALLAIGVLLFGSLIIVAPSLFGWAFGSEWRQAGNFTQWLALWTIVSFAARPSVAAIPVLGLERFFLLHEVISAVVRLSALLVGALLWDSAIVAIALFSIVNIVSYSVLTLIVLQVAKRSSTYMDQVAL
ncbi:lipopolysaccharide biosynthesis protein [Vreelandella sulfidaeris]|uniref:lipopolysaccharide biosynthesis protein n=1 Tax=Vreelandella sulfidaeris TaxID=115553 RepID=UPI0036DB9E20